MHAIKPGCIMQKFLHDTPRLNYNILIGVIACFIDKLPPVTSFDHAVNLATVVVQKFNFICKVQRNVSYKVMLHLRIFPIQNNLETH